MRKIIAISLICLYCFNLFGYMVMFHFLQQSSFALIVDHLDKGDYKSADLIELKVSWSLPYAIASKEYQRSDGEIEINGMQYNYVKKKLCNDTLYLLCVANKGKTKLLSAQQNYSSLVNDAASTTGDKKSNTPTGALQQLFAAVYNQVNTEYNLSAGFKSLERLHYTIEANLPNSFIPILHQPPKTLA